MNMTLKGMSQTRKKMSRIRIVILNQTEEFAQIYKMESNYKNW